MFYVIGQWPITGATENLIIILQSYLQISQDMQP